MEFNLTKKSIETTISKTLIRNYRQFLRGRFTDDLVHPTLSRPTGLLGGYTSNYSKALTPPLQYWR